MAQQILIDPVTRIEGHAKITIQLDDAGKVSDARFDVAEFKGVITHFSQHPTFIQCKDATIIVVDQNP